MNQPLVTARTCADVVVATLRDGRAVVELLMQGTDLYKAADVDPLLAINDENCARIFGMSIKEVRTLKSSHAALVKALTASTIMLSLLYDTFDKADGRKAIRDQIMLNNAALTLTTEAPHDQP